MTAVFPNAALGYRAWRVTPQGMLASTGRGATIWQPGDNRGYCAARGDHQVPDAGCECGLYLYSSFDRAHALARGIYGMTMIGAVAARGAAHVAEAGLRVEQARVIALALPKGKQHDPEDRSRAQQVAARYQVVLMGWDELQPSAERALGAPPRMTDIPALRTMAERPVSS